MPARKKSSRAREVQLLVGTRKGGFLFRSDLRRKSWRVEGPFFPGWEVNHLVRDPRSGKLWAAINTSWWGNDLQVSTNNGKSWQKSSAGQSVSACWSTASATTRQSPPWRHGTVGSI